MGSVGAVHGWCSAWLRGVVWTAPAGAALAVGGYGTLLLSVRSTLFILSHLLVQKDACQSRLPIRS